MLFLVCGVGEFRVTRELCRNCKARRPTTPPIGGFIPSRSNMSLSVDRPELSGFSQAWRTKAPSQAAEELASYSLETKRIPDPYYFLIDQDGDLFSPSAQIKVRSIIATNTRIGVLEAMAFDAISKWARQEESGAIAWLSPPEPGVYPTSKIIISEIEKANGAKRLLNRAIVLDIDKDECLGLGQRLGSYSTNRPFLNHSDELRSTPIILDTQQRVWTEIMEEVIPDAFLWNGVRRGDEIFAKQEALREAERIFGHNYYDDREMQQDMQRMLGEKSGSCPIRFTSNKGQTAFQVFSSHSLEADSMGSLSFPCPACGTINKRPREGYVERCWNSGCPKPGAVACK